MTYSPFFLTYGYHLNKRLEPKQENVIEAVGDFMQPIEEAQKTAKSALERLNALMKNQYDKHKKPAIDYKPGEKVYINTEHLPSVQQSWKLEKKFYGLYEIVEKVGQSAYQIRISASWKMYNVFNESLLKPYHAPHYANQKLKEKHTQDEQQWEDDDGDYELEQLLNSRISKQGQGWRCLEYLVKWKNYPLEEASWECTRSHRRVPFGTSRTTTTNLNGWENKGRYSTKGAKEIIWMAGWEVWARWSGTIGKGMGMMEGQGAHYSMGWRRQCWWICEDTNLEGGVMLWVTVMSLFFLSYLILSSHGWILYYVSILWDASWLPHGTYIVYIPWSRYLYSSLVIVYYVIITTLILLHFVSLPHCLYET